MSCYCDYEPSAVWDERIVKARKQHRCGDCNGIIKPGETYRRVGSLFDHQWSTLRRCADCAVIACDMNKLAGNDGCFCNLWGNMMQEMYDFADDDPAGCEPVFAAFNAASKERGGWLLSMERFEKEES